MTDTDNLHNHTPHSEFDSERLPDPNVIQRRASDPESSIWVHASAGTGKTKVLTDRILRLLLPQKSGAPGCHPHKILAITFTKTAAGEMSMRLRKTLSRWAILDEASLHRDLKSLLGWQADERVVSAARKLFASVVDCPGGLQIMTIHSFCQSILSRFPLEAGLPSNFQVLEEQEASQRLQQAINIVFQKAYQANLADDGKTTLKEALERIASVINQDQLQDTIKSLTAERHQLRRIFEKYQSNEGLTEKIFETLGLKPGIRSEELLATFCKVSRKDDIELREAGKALTESKSKTDQERGFQILRWLEAQSGQRQAIYEEYKGVFLTTKNEVRVHIATKKLGETYPWLKTCLERHADQVLQLDEDMRAAYCAWQSCDLLMIGHEVIQIYQGIKARQAVLDYDDLIFFTLDLLQGRGASKLKNMTEWVLYKLDQRIDHILVDEAQDTNPEQWKIIETLCEDFLAGDGTDSRTRSVFVVGDEKQSIYSFQRASPEEFERMRNDFTNRFHDAQKPWTSLQLNLSFRSSDAVLRLVDAVFNQPGVKIQNTDLPDLTHLSFRQGQGGHVELWPLYEDTPSEQESLWEPPVVVKESPSGALQLADAIATQIREWLDKKEILPSRNRPARPGDIIILVRTRTAFMHQLAQAIRRQKIPVNGVDRIVLEEQISVQDLLAAASFSLLPEDDYMLACLLKSPLIGLNEKALYNIAQGRSGSLFQAVEDYGDQTITQYLKQLIIWSRLRPFDFFENILQCPCPTDKRGGLRAMKARLGLDCEEILHAFLDLVLGYEKKHTAFLQNFLNWQSQARTEIKRESEGQGNAVRIMTIHGAKGLQAPIIFMPDTVRHATSPPGQQETKLIWPDKSGLTVPLWAPRKAEASAAFLNALDSIQARMEQEYLRLLYVAMTRAEDRLYICGYQKKARGNKTDWYDYIEAGFKTLPDAHSLENGRVYWSRPQTKPADREEEFEDISVETSDLPPWVFEEAPQEARSKEILRPSRMVDSERFSSPLSENNNEKFRRGIIIHKLLEILPDLPRDKREKAALAFLKSQATYLSAQEQGKALDEVMGILNHPDFSDFFQHGSMAEVPLTAVLEGKLLSGQVDRLKVSQDTVWVIDYKTNRPVPATEASIPEIYIQQMKAYADTLHQIYPGRSVRCGLLWTDGPKFIEISSCATKSIDNA